MSEGNINLSNTDSLLSIQLMIDSHHQLNGKIIMVVDLGNPVHKNCDEFLKSCLMGGGLLGGRDDDDDDDADKSDDDGDVDVV